MRWEIKRKPILGDSRIKRKFAFMPVKIGNEMVWLEFYDSHQRYEPDLDERDADYYVFGGAHDGWKEVSRKTTDTDWDPVKE